MNLLFLRGKADRPGEIAFDRLADDDDMWTHLAHEMLGVRDQGEVVYWGALRYVEYDQYFRVRWVPTMKDYRPVHAVPGHDGATANFFPDVCIARGGFAEYAPVLRRLPKECLRVYYGAGKRWRPKRLDAWDLLLCDSRRQIAALGQSVPVNTWMSTFPKPAAPQFRVDYTQPASYDICYVATVPGDRRKRVKWVWRTAPKQLRILQLGLPPDGTPPPNVTVKHVSRAQMPKYISRCAVTVCPYTEDDGAPRIVSESLACGVPVLYSPQMHLEPAAESPYLRCAGDMSVFWGMAAMMAEEPPQKWHVRAFYEQHYSLPVAVLYLRGVLTRLEHAKQHLRYR